MSQAGSPQPAARMAFDPVEAVIPTNALVHPGLLLVEKSDTVASFEEDTL